MLWLAAAADDSPSARRSAAHLSDAIRADMPQLMTLYRDLHANPELSMQEVRTPAKLAAEMRKLGFDVTEHVGKTGVVAVMKNGAGPGAADPRRHGRACRSRSRPACPSRPRRSASCPTAPRRRHACLRPRHAHRHLARHGAAAGGDEGPMVGHAGDDPPARRRDRRGRQGDARRRPVHALSQARHVLAFHDSARRFRRA